MSNKPTSSSNNGESNWTTEKKKKLDDALQELYASERNKFQRERITENWLEPEKEPSSDGIEKFNATPINSSHTVNVPIQNGKTIGQKAIDEFLACRVHFTDEELIEITENWSKSMGQQVQDPSLGQEAALQTFLRMENEIQQSIWNKLFRTADGSESTTAHVISACSVLSTASKSPYGKQGTVLEVKKRKVPDIEEPSMIETDCQMKRNSGVPSVEQKTQNFPTMKRKFCFEKFDPLAVPQLSPHAVKESSRPATVPSSASSTPNQVGRRQSKRIQEKKEKKAEHDWRHRYFHYYESEGEEE